MNNGIPYFPHETSLPDEVRIIQSQFGLLGYAVIFKLYERIFSQGYFTLWSDKICRLFALEDCRYKFDAVSKVIEACLEEGVFDKTLYEKFGILTSRDIQLKFFHAAKNRKNFKMRDEFCLICDLSDYNNSSPHQSPCCDSFSTGEKPHGTSMDVQKRSNVSSAGNGKVDIFEEFPRGDDSAYDYIENSPIFQPWLEFFDTAVIIAAFEICYRKGKKNADYLFGILGNYKKRGIVYVDQIDDPMFVEPDYRVLFKRNMEVLNDGKA